VNETKEYVLNKYNNEKKKERKKKEVDYNKKEK